MNPGCATKTLNKTQQENPLIHENKTLVGWVNRVDELLPNKKKGL